MADWDPAFRDLPVLDALGEQIAGAARAQELGASSRGARMGGGRRRLHGPKRVALVVLLILGLIASVAIAATKLIDTGRPVPAAPGASRLGTIVPGTTRLLSVRAADPAGGPPWGLRVFRTKDKLACVQVGRVVDGKLGVLGQDGVFGNDHRFHELPVASEGCGGLDRANQMFMSGGGNTQTASGFDGAGDRVVGGCETREDRRGRTYDVRTLRDALRLQLRRHEYALARVQRRVIARYERRARTRIPLCPDADVRDVIWGFEGSLAQKVTLTEHGQTHTVTPAKHESGAYLVVLRGNYTQHRSLGRRTYYAHGIVCGRGFGVHDTAGCSPPPGFQAPAPRPLPPRFQRLRHRAQHPLAPMHVPITVFPGLAIRFTAPIAGHRYSVIVQCSRRVSMELSSRKLLRGPGPQTVRLRGPLPPFCDPHGVGTVTDVTTGRRIGTFRLRATRPHR